MNQPGCYRDVKDTTVVAQFKAVRNDKSAFLFESTDTDVYFIAWTTTPWTLAANSALAVGKGITYVSVRTFNPYTFTPVTLVVAKELFEKYFPEKNSKLKLEEYQDGDKSIPFKVIAEFKGADIEGIEYEQLLPYVQPDTPAFRVITGDFVSTEDGTGIVHIAPTFGSDDFRVAAANDIPPIMVTDENGVQVPIVDTRGRYVKEITDFPGVFVKQEYESPEALTKDYKSLDVRLAIKLKTENKAFKVEKYEHSYPHCWRTDKPVLYYPLDSWFIKTTAVKDRLIELNKTINWKPASTGTGRFGNWLENLQDWNLSRSRYWGTPLPIWTNGKKGNERKLKCVGAISELKENAFFIVNKPAFDAQYLTVDAEGDLSELWASLTGSGVVVPLESLDKELDLHKHFVDFIVYFENGEIYFRESDLIDVWFDSGAMPFAQFHKMDGVPNSNFENQYPADFIAEGVDQTRGWFFTLHAISVMLEDRIAYKNVVSNGLVLDKEGRKMSKRLGNTVDPFDTIKKYGADATRWYIIGNAPPWENLKFNADGIGEVLRKYFGTLYNTYSFYALYANIDGFKYDQDRIPADRRPEIDQWIISLLNTLVSNVEGYMDDYDATKAVRALEEFVTENLSNWYVRLCRRRFWKGKLNDDKIAAYQTLYECLLTISKLMSSFAPFYADRLFCDLNSTTGHEAATSVHLSDFPTVNAGEVDADLEERMQLAQEISSLVHSIRKRKDVSLKIRQPLNKILVPVLSEKMKTQVEKVSDLVKSEVNVKEVQYITEDSDILVRKAKPNFRELGKKAGKLMREVKEAVEALSGDQIRQLEAEGNLDLQLNETTFNITLNEVEIVSQDIPGWSVATNGRVTVALDITLTEALKHEGIAREFVNRIQNLRKDAGFEVTDKIKIQVSKNDFWNNSIKEFLNYICNETLAESLELAEDLKGGNEVEVNGTNGTILIEKSNG